MPKYQYLGCGPVTTKTAKTSGNQYVQRVVYAAAVKDDGTLASATNIYLTGDKVNLPDGYKLQAGDMVFVDYTSKGFINAFCPCTEDGLKSLVSFLLNGKM